MSRYEHHAGDLVGRKRWKEGARRDIEEVFAEWIEHGQPQVIRDSLAAGKTVEEMVTFVSLMDAFNLTVWRSLPPRRGRGGLTRAARVVSAYMKKVSAPRKRGRPTGTPEYSPDFIADLVERVDARKPGVLRGTPLGDRAALLDDISEYGVRQHLRPDVALRKWKYLVGPYLKAISRARREMN